MLKKWITIGICAILLTGCAAPTFETLGDISHQQVAAPVPQKVVLKLPEGAVKSVWSGEGDTMYLCNDYTLHLQTMDAGDLRKSIRLLSGFAPENLTLVKSTCGDHDRYEWVWTAAGEGGDAVYRCALLDDGNFHYALTVTASASTAGTLTEEWKNIMSTFCLEHTEN
jgi:hypothetical protein